MPTFAQTKIIMAYDYFDRVRHIRTGIRVYSDLLIERSLDVRNIKTRIGLFFFSLVLSIAGAYFLSPDVFTKAQTYTLFVFFCDSSLGNRSNSSVCCTDFHYGIPDLYHAKCGRRNHRSGDDFKHMVRLRNLDFPRWFFPE